MAKELVKEILSAADVKDNLHTAFTLLIQKVKEDITANA